MTLTSFRGGYSALDQMRSRGGAVCLAGIAKRLESICRAFLVDHGQCDGASIYSEASLTLRKHC